MPISQDNGEDITQVTKAIEEPLIDGLLGADESHKTSVYELHQMNRESTHFSTDNGCPSSRVLG